MKAFIRIRWRFFCSCICTLLQRAWYFLLGFFKKCIQVKIKIKSTFKIDSKQLSSFPIQNLGIRNMLHICISTGVLQLVKQQHFPEFATKWFVKNQWKIFSNAPCRFLAHFLYLKSMCIEFCHLHIQQRQSLLVFQKTCHRYTVQFLHLCRVESLLRLYGFCTKWKIVFHSFRP